MFSNQHYNKKESEWEGGRDYLYVSVPIPQRRLLSKQKEKVSHLLAMLMEVLQLNPWTSLWKHTPNVHKSVGFFFLSAKRKSDQIYFAPPLILIHYLCGLCEKSAEKHNYTLLTKPILFSSEINADFISIFFFLMLIDSLFFLPWRGYLQGRGETVI